MAVFNAFLAKVVTQVINPIILLLAATAFVAVLWGIVVFVFNSGDETKRKEGREAIFWGLVGLVIIFGVYGILAILTSTFNLPPVQKISS